MLPVKNGRISQEYGRKNSQYRKGYHPGIDVVADGADKSIYAVSPGVVIRARFSPGSKGADPTGWGNYVIVRQVDGHDVLYAHLAQVAVTAGQLVVAGDKLGIQGATGSATGPHLHFEVWDGDWTKRNDINPAEYLGIANQVGPVSLKDPFEEDRQWAVENGISDGSDPNRAVLRKEVWAMLRRMKEGR
ncbi:MAG: M23 family metallopeptidase [Peptococcaceae bacterium]|jgi:murein DD-endopeptidase MepM/ murein hydrolase activator NlpD|nr:M23 family metallopeptidase [Peptococcaceae bacterium]MDH7525744.1 M23 family metallopeptidase [Peptococcaceae bacterium]